MNKKPNSELISRDNPMWIDEMFKPSVRLSDLPQGLREKLARPARGLQKAPVKVSTTIRLSPDVVQAFRAGGDGWQTRIDAALKDWLRTHSPG
uniref:Antitoxin of addiction module, BrnA family n=1 Tax=Polaromonas sp. E19S TaxID=1840257 RepID=A0A2S1FI51_9BURK|nr:BrnA antitoxin family protein [Polaromonas sp. E19S]AWD72029.1 antitoxin of addiction module, BrnA family [Polaromonas sp. E19S]